MLAYIVVFTCTWWVVFFMVLPFNIQTQKSSEIGHDKGAPTKPYLGIKMLVTSVIAVILTKLIINLINAGYLAMLADKYINFLSSL